MIEEFQSFLNEKGKSEHTIKSYLSDMNIFFLEMKIKPSDYVTESDVRKWIHRQLHEDAEKQLAASTITRRINSLKSFYKWAYKKGYVSFNPMEEISAIKVADEANETIVWLTDHEFEDLLERLRKMPVKSRGVDPEEKYRKDRILFYIAVYLGLRVSEISKLKESDLDLSLQKARIVGKGNKVRTLPISNILKMELIDWFNFKGQIALSRKDVAESPYVLYSQQSGKLSVRSIQRIVESYSTEEKKLYPHVFRHTFCVWLLIASNNNLGLVKRLAGHKSIHTTEKYTKAGYSELVGAIEKLPAF